MNSAATVETGEEVLAAARAAGFDPSEKQRKDWRRAGLLPRPLDQKGKGRELGSVTFYPPGTSALLVALCRHSRPKKPLPQLALLVWSDGHRLPDGGVVRSALQRALDEWERLTGPWASFNGVPATQWAALDRRLATRLPTPLRVVRDRVGKGPFRQFVAFLLNVAAGGFDGFRPYQGADADDAQSDAKAGLGIEGAPWVVKDVTATLTDLSTILRPVMMREALDNATEADLEMARDEVRSLVGLFDNLHHLTGRLGGKEGLELFEPLDARHLTVGMLAWMTLFWLNASRRPALRRGYQQLIPVAEQLAALRQVLDLTQVVVNKEPLRRHQPPGSYAD